MTRISTIHGIGQDEYAGRAGMVSNGNYIPYLSLTKGEMELYLAAQRARIRADWYGSDAPQYAEAYQMIENALHAGVHRGVNWVGAVPDYLQDVARFIRQAEKQTAPASRGLFVRTPGVSGIGQTVIPVTERWAECLKWAESANHNAERKRRRRECETRFNIEKIFNNQIENVGHHMLYHNISQALQMPERVFTKLILQLSGVQGMAGAGDIANDLMASWVETGILRKNATSPVIGPLSSTDASFQLAPDPASWINKYKNTQAKKNKTGGVQGISLGPIGLALIPLVVAAVKAAIEIAKSLITQNAIIKAQGFGTTAYSATGSDWITGVDNPETSGGVSNNMLLLAAGAAALLLLSDDK